MIGRSYLKGPKNKKQQQGQRSLEKGGLTYQIDFAAADPVLYTTSAVPYPEKFASEDLIIGRGDGEASIPFAKFNDGCSIGGDLNVNADVGLSTGGDANVKEGAGTSFANLNGGLSTGGDAKVKVGAGTSFAGGGRDLLNANVEASIALAKINDVSSTDVKVESLMPESLYLGQIVPFEIKISVTGSQAPEDGNIQFTAGWSTETTSRVDFGYDATIGVLAAFVDTGDCAHNDPSGDASVSSFNWSIVKGNEIQGVFNITGLDDGDEVVVEVWVVISGTFPSAGANGNVHSRLIDATTSRDKINTGTQTVPMMKKGGGELRFATATSSEEVTDAEALKYLC
jgi:hypothetical protein